MKKTGDFHVLIVGWSDVLKAQLWDRIDERSDIRFSHLLHPRHTRDRWPDNPGNDSLHFFSDTMAPTMPVPNRELLGSLELPGVPTLHNMIMGDRVVSKLGYPDALSYATFLAQRLFQVFGDLRPSVVIASFDSLHSSLALAVARRLDIPWFALSYTVLPKGLACFCEETVPSALVLFGGRDESGPMDLAEQSLSDFESNRMKAFAYIQKPPLSLLGSIRRTPGFLLELWNILRRSRHRGFLQFVDARSSYSVPAAFSFQWRAMQARRALARMELVSTPPASRYVFFGLHFQPESSIDVWAPFFSNQMWVIELLSRSIPPTHKLMVKIHKSDTANYNRAELERMKSFPGVEIVAPFADTRQFIENADLIVAVQGSIGLEGALLGKPVIMLGDSPVAGYPSVTQIGKIQELPALISRKLGDSRPDRDDIVSAYAAHLAPFMPANHNNWRVTPTSDEIDNYVELMAALREHLTEEHVGNVYRQAK